MRRRKTGLKHLVACWLIRVILPLQLGICLYVAGRPMSLQGWQWASLIGLSEAGHWAREALSPAIFIVPELIVNSAPASLWLFSTTSAIVLIWGKEQKKGFWCWLWIALAVGLGSEFAQYVQWVQGTYDHTDAALYFLAWWLALQAKGVNLTKKHCLSLLTILVAGMLAVGTSDSGSGRDSRTSVRSPSSTPASGPPVIVRNESKAAAEDVRQAKELLRQMPPACAKSGAAATDDGEITVTIVCGDEPKSLNGLIRIKNGIVTEIQ